MRTRRSPRNQDRLFRELFKPKLAAAVPVRVPMTRDEIIASNWGKADKTRALKALAKEELRQRVQAALATEREGGQ